MILARTNKEKLLSETFFQRKIYEHQNTTADLLDQKNISLYEIKR